MNTNEWKSIIKALDLVGSHGLTQLSPQDLLKLHSLLDHWQKMTAGEVSNRIKNTQIANVTQKRKTDVSAHGVGARP